LGAFGVAAYHAKVRPLPGLPDASPRGFLARRLIALLGAGAVVAAATLGAGLAPAGAADPTPSSSSSSASSSASSSDVTPASTPGAPTILNVRGGLASGQLVVTYSAPSSDGGSPITSYEASIDRGAVWWPCAGTSGECVLTNLRNGTQYRVALRAVNALGAGVVTEPAAGVPTLPMGSDPDKPSSLPKPRAWVGASFNAASNSLGVDGSKVRLGVGTLPAITFTRPIPDKRVVETHLGVSAVLADGKVRKVDGAWGWTSDRTVVFRPKEYWPGHATVLVTSTMDRAVLGRSGSTYLVGKRDLAQTWTFRTDRKLIAQVDGARVNMRVFIDGQRAATFPVSLGKSGWETRNGVKVISTDKEPVKIYRSTSLGLGPEEEYELEADWNTRLTPTGEFIHTATWAYGRIGIYNGSHGCTNMRAEDAQWIYQKTIPGDVVVYANTGGTTVQEWNGPGGLWNIPWAEWLKKSALGSGSGQVDTTTEAPTSVVEDASA
jgi:lipoprotein-anchoring transpeptidase ErfK/SrfK